MVRAALYLLGVLIVAAGLLAGAYVWFVGAVAAPGPLAAPTTVIVAPGSGVPAIARQLTDAHVVAQALFVELEARRTGKARALKPGEYRFEPGVSIDGAIDKIVRHDVVARYVTVAEGLVTAEALHILQHAAGLKGEIGAQPGEGELLPETYRYEWGDSRDTVVSRMRAARNAVLSELWDARAADLPLRSPAEALVLASIVEKETGLAAERPRVAAVFINRLRRGMKLQSDPTVIYGLEQSGDFDGSLTHADLEQPTAFNTYVIDGLPPTPICNPGRASIAAVLAPAQTEDLYFVADGSGGHVFAPTLEQHNHNVAQWRKLRERTP